MKKQHEPIYVPLGFENLMGRLYGYAGHGCCAGHTSISDFKKHVTRIVSSLKNKIRRSVCGDDAHRDVLMKKCDDMLASIKSCQSKDELLCRISQYCLDIMFQLVGGTPDNIQKQRTNSQSVTSPPTYRSLYYVRSDEQRSRQILD